jgi:hypothetical protein
MPDRSAPRSLRDLPSVDRLLADPRVAALAAAHGRGAVRDAVRRALEGARREIRAGTGAGDPAERVERPGFAVC